MELMTFLERADSELGTALADSVREMIKNGDLDARDVETSVEKIAASGADKRPAPITVAQRIDAAFWRDSGVREELLGIEADSVVGASTVHALNAGVGLLFVLECEGGAEAIPKITRALVEQVHIWYFG